MGERFLFTSELLIGGIPVDNQANRSYASRMGFPPGQPWPQPYLNSTLDICDNCDGAIWIGPAVAQQRASLTARRVPFETFCLTCVVVKHGKDFAVVSLTDKKQGE